MQVTFFTTLIALGFDPDGVMQFKAFRGLSESYRRAVEGHTAWTPDSPDPQPIWVSDVAADGSLEHYRPVFASEGIAALAFIPLVSLDRVIGKFMLYFDAPTAARADDLQRANVVAAQVAFALDRTRTKEQAPQRGAYSVCAGRGVDGHVGLGSRRPATAAISRNPSTPAARAHGARRGRGTNRGVVL